jgi:hypothetical protein
MSASPTGVMVVWVLLPTGTNAATHSSEDTIRTSRGASRCWCSQRGLRRRLPVYAHGYLRRISLASCLTLHVPFSTPSTAVFAVQQSSP